MYTLTVWICKFEFQILLWIANDNKLILQESVSIVSLFQASRYLTFKTIFHKMAPSNLWSYSWGFLRLNFLRATMPQIDSFQIRGNFPFLGVTFCALQTPIALQPPLFWALLIHLTHCTPLVRIKAAWNSGCIFNSMPPGYDAKHVTGSSASFG